MIEKPSKEEVERQVNTLSQKSTESSFCDVVLCHDKLDFVKMNAQARLSNTCFEATDTSVVQCDYAFGGKFTSYHNFIMDPENTEKFYHCLSESQDLLINAKHVREKFCGPEWLAEIEKYCQDHNIKYIYHYRSAE